ncbi:PAX3- and PAX7-binding protein 1-like [Uranotaenia lowii]|uniref:PAX3- and PAX7-binding protein 1-like n=1 Tax=Uranotaenia lowii TaxID=190385 RepID=UPI00247A4652|nr:PAX3- and PAX7-binding protein 1-like [Uranotaenia lowii]
MSLFRKPKKPIQRRVFTSYDDDEEDTAAEGHHPRLSAQTQSSSSPSVGGEGVFGPSPAFPIKPPPSSYHDGLAMDVDSVTAPPPPSISFKTSSKNKDKKQPKPGSANSSRSSSTAATKLSLLSFDDEEEGEVFQVKKTSQSKKVMKSLDKERRRKRHAEKNGFSTSSSSSFSSTKAGRSSKDETNEEKHAPPQPPSDKDKLKKEKCENTSSIIQTEIRTDDFVLVVKKSDPDNLILNGRAALCAGRDDMSSEDEEGDNDEEQDGEDHHHRFAKPDNFKMYLENGVIPDAAMIHAARKRRQKAREQGDFIPIEETKEDKTKKRVVREDGAGDGSDEDDDRIDMAAITGAKEREERREQFYSVQREDSAEESDYETKEWENQQIRKGVTGAQLVSAHQESVISQYMIQGYQQHPFTTADDEAISTAALLEQAYAKSGNIGLTKLSTRAASSDLISNVKTAGKQDHKATGPRMPQEILKQLSDRLETTRDLNYKHINDIERITTEVKVLKLDHLQSEQKAPAAAGRYRFYQEIKCYVCDLVECLDEKLPQIITLEQRAIALTSKYSTMLIERRRQDVRDQAKEMADAGKNIKRTNDDPERVRRAAEREGRRTRRRRDREKNETSESHLDGMSSDDEVADVDVNQFKASLKEVAAEASTIFEDVTREYCDVGEILDKFQSWREAEMGAYKDAYVSLCLPKLLGPFIRLRHVCWNPVSGEDEFDFERQDWYRSCILYGRSFEETESSLAEDPDVRLVPTLIEKIVLPKLTVLIQLVWDPLSTTQTLKLVRLINRLSREYPSLRRTCKQLRNLFQAILDKLKVAIDNDVFIPVFPKQLQEAKSSFFQRQFCSGLKLLRNITCWQGIIADTALTELAIGLLLNRYLLNGMRVCTPTDSINKASMIVYTLPRVWLSANSPVVQNLSQFIAMLRNVENHLDLTITGHGDLIEKVKKILVSLHVAN